MLAGELGRAQIHLRPPQQYDLRADADAALGEQELGALVPGQPYAGYGLLASARPADARLRRQPLGRLESDNGHRHAGLPCRHRRIYARRRRHVGEQLDPARDRAQRLQLQDGSMLGSDGVMYINTSDHRMVEQYTRDWAEPARCAGYARRWQLGPVSAASCWRRSPASSTPSLMTRPCSRRAQEAALVTTCPGRR